MSAHRDAMVLRTGTSHAGRSNLPMQSTRKSANEVEPNSANQGPSQSGVVVAVHGFHPPEGTPRARRPRRTQRANGARKGLADAARSGSTSRVGERTKGEG